LQGGVEEIPSSILKQLKSGGRVGAIFIEEGLGTAKIGSKLDDKINWRYSFTAAAPVLPGFFKQKDFAL
jgi:protein-L-isoaspartate(D-aspartate) O-methyltransferase